MSVISFNLGTGQAIQGLAHLRASVADILSTPIGSRVMRRSYGSRLSELLDQNLNALTIAQVYAATADALRRWEPRLKVSQVQVEASSDLASGKLEITVIGEYLPDGKAVTLAGLFV